MNEDNEKRVAAARRMASVARDTRRVLEDFLRDGIRRNHNDQGRALGLLAATALVLDESAVLLDGQAEELRAALERVDDLATTIAFPVILPAAPSAPPPRPRRRRRRAR